MEGLVELIRRRRSEAWMAGTRASCAERLRGEREFLLQVPEVWVCTAARIAEQSPALGAFLQQTFKTGSHCVYMPRAAPS